MKKKLQRMCKSLSLVFITIFCFSIYSNAQLISNDPINKIVAKKYPYQYFGNEVLTSDFVPSIHQQLYEHHLNSQTTNVRIDVETWIGFTSFDKQSSASPKRGVYGDTDGNIAAAWSYHPETADPNTTFPNQGTGFNLFSGSWGGFPSSRLESNIKTEGPNVLYTSTGKKVIVTSTTDQEGIFVLTQDAGATSFTESNIPSNTNLELVGVHAAISGDVIHVIAVTNPNGPSYENQNGALLYFRSSDGGVNWDITDAIVEGTGFDFYTGHDVDAYSIAAKGTYVAVGIFKSWGDVVVSKSYSFGDPGTWSKRIAFDFPLDNYLVDSGYDVNDIGGADPNAPEQLAIETSDGSGGIEVEEDGTVHVVFGRMFVKDDELTDGLTDFFPGTNGLFYWNSSLPENGASTIDAVFDAIDIDDNGTVEMGDDLAYYGGGLTSMPSIVLTTEGAVVISYVQHMENYLREAVPGSMNFPLSQNYRHIYVTASGDNGNSWVEPYDVINSDVLFFPALLPQTEAIFPSLFADINGRLHLTYQMDEEPGIFLNNSLDAANDPVTSNTIAHWSFDLFDIYDDLIVDLEDVESKENLQFSVFPNPTDGKINIKNLEVDRVQIFDNVGRLVLNIQPLGNLIDISKLTSGMYFLKIFSASEYVTTKVIKE